VHSAVEPAHLPAPVRKPRREREADGLDPLVEDDPPVEADEGQGVDLKKSIAAIITDKKVKSKLKNIGFCRF
jgi:hypothetical protein